MDKKIAIELLKQALNEIPSIKDLHHDNQDFVLWRNKIRDIIKAGLNPDDYRTYATAHPSAGLIRGQFPDSRYQQEYIENLTKYETAIKSIIQKYEILGIEEQPSIIKFPTPEQRYQTRGVESESTVLAETPIQLFDAMHFHPKVIEASKKRFQDGNYTDAIFRAFVALNNTVKEKSGLSIKELRGLKDSQLMAKVFDVDHPIIKLNNLQTDSDISEQEGFKFLFMGATIGIRNPKGHDNIVQDDPFKTLEYLGFASLLFKTVDFWETGNT